MAGVKGQDKMSSGKVAERCDLKDTGVSGTVEHVKTQMEGRVLKIVEEMEEYTWKEIN